MAFYKSQLTIISLLTLQHKINLWQKLDAMFNCKRCLAILYKAFVANFYAEDKLLLTQLFWPFQNL